MKKKLGPTGDFPKGKIRHDDEGGIAVAIGHDNGKVFIDYGAAITWVAFDPHEAEDFAKMIQAHAMLARFESKMQK